jgi:hypothetical protein
LQANLDWNFFSRLWLKIFKQGLIYNFQARSWSRLKMWAGTIKVWLNRDWSTLCSDVMTLSGLRPAAEAPPVAITTNYL